MTNGTDSGSDDQTLPLISDHIIGNYQLVRAIGSGTMGEVYLARHRQFKDRQYAIKLIRQGMISAEARTRFEREILAIGDLAHPNLVYANDAGMDGDRMYLVMEYVPGQELQCMIDQNGKFRVTFAAEIIRQICIGIAHAHQRSVVHRDIKPANVMLSEQMQVKVLDLGIASLQNDASSRMTTAQSVMGTAPFISPELWEGATNATPASDIYAIGCTAYCLLTGDPPFSGAKYQSLTSVMLAHRESAPTPLRMLRKDIPPLLNQILARTLEKNPASRLNDSAELAQLLAPFCEPLPRDTTKLFGTTDHVDLPTVRTDSDTDPSLDGDAKRKLGAVSIGIVMLSLIAILGVIAFQKVSKTGTIEPLVVDQTWMPAGCQKAPGATTVTVEFGGLKERLWSEIQLISELQQSDAGTQSITLAPILFVLVPQCGTGSPMSFYIMKEKTSKRLFKAFEAAYPDLIDLGAREEREKHRDSDDERSPVFWVSGYEATQFAMRICGGQLPKPDQWDAAYGRGFSEQVFENWISADASYTNYVLSRASAESSEHHISRWGCVKMGSLGLEFTRFNLESDVIADSGGSDQTELPERELRGQSAFSDGGVLQIKEWTESEMSGDVYFGTKPINDLAEDVSFRVVLDKDH